MRELDFESLSTGQRFLSGTHRITAEAIVAFAREFDVQPFHLDSAAAAASLFRGLAASGWHTAAIAMRLFTTTMKFRGGAIGLSVEEMRWPVAVRPDDDLTLETEILALRESRSKPRHGVVQIRNTLRNQKSEVVLVYTANALVARRDIEG